VFLGTKAYQARIRIDGKRVYLGSFRTIKEAEEAYLTRKEGIDISLEQ
jgi:hypothetical protein